MVVCKTNNDYLLSEFMDDNTARLLLKFFFDDHEAMKETMYVKFNQDSERELLLSKLLMYLPSQYHPSSSDFFSTPLNKVELDKEKFKVKGKKILFKDLKFDYKRRETPSEMDWKKIVDVESKFYDGHLMSSEVEKDFFSLSGLQSFSIHNKAKASRN